MNCILIKKLGKIKNTKLTDQLFILCGFKNSENFGLRMTWEYKDYFVSLYSKNDGKAGEENKYELPPPIDKDLYFGNIIIISHKNEDPNQDEILDFSIKDWNDFYNHIFNGFEDLESSEEETEEENIPKEFLNKHGYSKESGFIVDDNEPIELLSDYEEEIMNESDFYISDTDNEDDDIHNDEDDEDVEDVEYDEDVEDDEGNKKQEEDKEDKKQEEDKEDKKGDDEEQMDGENIKIKIFEL